MRGGEVRWVHRVIPLLLIGSECTPSNCVGMLTNWK